MPLPFVLDRPTLTRPLGPTVVLPPLLPGSGFFRRAPWNYVRKAFFSPFAAPAPLLLSRCTRPSQPTSLIFLYSPFSGALLSTLTSTDHPSSAVSSPALHRTRLKAAPLNFSTIFHAIFAEQNTFKIIGDVTGIASRSKKETEKRRRRSFRIPKLREFFDPGWQTATFSGRTKRAR